VLGEAESLAAALGVVDATQETKRLAELPDAVRKYYVAKATLYIALKMINDAAHAVFAGDSPTACRFNLTLLYRTAGRPRPPVTPAPAPTNA
jgi:hypothetical protein